jgi:hypothetical protein
MRPFPPVCSVHSPNAFPLQRASPPCLSPPRARLPPAVRRLLASHRPHLPRLPRRGLDAAARRSRGRRRRRDRRCVAAGAACSVARGVAKRRRAGRPRAAACWARPARGRSLFEPLPAHADRARATPRGPGLGGWARAGAALVWAAHPGRARRWGRHARLGAAPRVAAGARRRSGQHCTDGSGRSGGAAAARSQAHQRGGRAVRRCASRFRNASGVTRRRGCQQRTTAAPFAHLATRDEGRGRGQGPAAHSAASTHPWQAHCLPTGPRLAHRDPPCLRAILCPVQCVCAYCACVLVCAPVCLGTRTRELSESTGALRRLHSSPCRARRGRLQSCRRYPSSHPRRPIAGLCPPGASAAAVARGTCSSAGAGPREVVPVSLAVHDPHLHDAGSAFSPSSCPAAPCPHAPPEISGSAAEAAVSSTIASPPLFGWPLARSPLRGLPLRVRGGARVGGIAFGCVNCCMHSSCSLGPPCGPSPLPLAPPAGTSSFRRVPLCSPFPPPHCPRL